MEERLIRLRELLEILRISKSTLYAHIKAGNIPAPIHITPRTSAWRLRDIDKLIEQRSSSTEK